MQSTGPHVWEKEAYQNRYYSTKFSDMQISNKFEMSIKSVVVIFTFEGISNFSSQYELSEVNLSLLAVGTFLKRTDKESLNNAMYTPQ